MDLETENRLAALLMEEARRMRDQADKEGVHVYLRQPNIRDRPNSRFLTATVLGVEQANRAVEVNEMWRAREKELELDAKLKSRAKNKDICYGGKHHGDSIQKVSSSRCDDEACRSSSVPSSSNRDHGHGADTCYSSDDGGLRDDELEEFLHSRAKRGRGAVGSRMDEPGPYPSSTSLGHGDGKKEEWECRILGPAKPLFIKPDEVPPNEVCDAHSSQKKKKRSKEERSERRKKKKEKKKSKHRHHNRRRSD